MAPSSPSHRKVRIPRNSGCLMDQKAASPSFHLLLSAPGAAPALKRSGGKLDRTMVGRDDGWQARSNVALFYNLLPILWRTNFFRLSTADIALFSVEGKCQEYVAWHTAPLAVTGIHEDHAVDHRGASGVH